MSVMIGFQKNGNKIREILPQSEQLSTEIERRTLFFNLYNYYVDKEMKISKEEMTTGENIYEIFKKKEELTPDSSSMKIKFKNLIDFQDGNLLFDLNDMFLHLVYERIKLVNKDVKISLFENTIIIHAKEEGVSPTLLIPSYIKVDSHSPYQDVIVSSHIKRVLKTLNETEIRQVYLVYPKHLKFKKHIEIKLMEKTALTEDEYRVKMIPYSFSFCTRAVKKACSCTPKQQKGRTTCQ